MDTKEDSKKKNTKKKKSKEKNPNMDESFVVFF